MWASALAGAFYSLQTLRQLCKVDILTNVEEADFQATLSEIMFSEYEINSVEKIIIKNIEMIKIENNIFLIFFCKLFLIEIITL